ncbi:hypothetical protein [Blastochloris viridis]|uniref:TolA protein n=1 Tax=Blastochloris viridis TaxID=1079 RepID=A0A0H5BAU8_BLAVI|nr:hypothetical protein [Blastochloris viridis]ALK10718.1 hypothetical protein BVIR_2955 [Blastochloris viridis]BAR99315.1 TolA protein [Blastochloris viridis]CUU43380.1 hypothetical protein BVIRIDIS_23990 [Blastochloris viridis]
MRKGLAISAAAHLVIATAAIVFAGPAPFAVEPEAGIEVELVPSDAAPPDQTAAPKMEPAKVEPPKDDPAPDETPKRDTPPDARPGAKDDGKTPPAPAADAGEDKPGGTPPDAGQPPQASPAGGAAAPPAGEVPTAEPSAAEVPEPFDAEMMTQMAQLNRPGDFDAAATEKAKLTPDEIAALKASVQKCWAAPPGIAGDTKLRVMMRVSFKRNGALAGEPALIAGTASRFGPALMRAAQDALRRCQPYAVLPPGKYPQWRMLDLPFTPDGISGG